MLKDKIFLKNCAQPGTKDNFRTVALGEASPTMPEISANCSVRSHLDSQAPPREEGFKPITERQNGMSFSSSRGSHREVC